MTYKTRPLLGNDSHTTPAGLVYRRQGSTPLLSLPTKLVCAGGLVVIATCIIILVVTHTDTYHVEQTPQYSVLVIGGTTRHGVSQSVENIYQGWCNTTESPAIPDLPQPLGHIIGGYLTSGAVLVCGVVHNTSSCYLFRTGSDSWVPAPGLGQLSHHASMVTMGDMAYVVQNMSCSAYHGTLGTWQPCPPPPIPLHKHCATRLVIIISLLSISTLSAFNHYHFNYQYHHFDNYHFFYSLSSTSLYSVSLAMMAYS